MTGGIFKPLNFIWGGFADLFPLAPRGAVAHLTIKRPNVH
ncbi:hypothetical protein Z947_2419 [Sulfitobacter geojensis]|nr:hypothetical protein Z947_2419 [Sulfitobacter geojensis]